MPAPPLRTEISDTYPLPSDATARAGFGKLWDYCTGLLGATGNGAEARAAIGVLAIAESAPPVRQTVLSGPVDTNGFAAFVGATGSTTVTATATLKAAAAAGGGANYTGSITNPSWTGLATNGTMHLFLDITSAGVVTTGSTTLAPTYQWGGSYSTTNNQHTFNIQEMTMKVGNGAAASQVYRVFVGQVTVAGGVVTAISWYQLQGRYDSGWTATLPGTFVQLVKSHALGFTPDDFDFIIECTTADQGHSVGARLKLSQLWTGDATGRMSVSIYATAAQLVLLTGSAAGLAASNASTGVGASLTAASWKYKFIAGRSKKW